MNIKKILASVFAVAIVGSTAAVSAYAQGINVTEPYKSSYYYSETATAMSTSTPVLTMVGYQRGSEVLSAATNLSSGNMYLETSVTVYSNGGKEIDEDIQSGTSSHYYCASCKDYSSYFGGVYYVHGSTLMGNVQVSSSKVASIKITVK